MKKITYLILFVVAFGCHKKETNRIKETENLIDKKNPLNQLKYANTIDFYCKMDITKYGVSDTTTYKGNLYGFCSPMCKHKFLMEPETYLNRK